MPNLNDAKRLAELIESVRYAMFTSRNADGGNCVPGR